MQIIGGKQLLLKITCKLLESLLSSVCTHLTHCCKRMTHFFVSNVAPNHHISFGYGIITFKGFRANSSHLWGWSLWGWSLQFVDVHVEHYSPHTWGWSYGASWFKGLMPFYTPLLNMSRGFLFTPITQADYRLHDTADEPRLVSGIPPAQYQASATQ